MKHRKDIIIRTVRNEVLSIMVLIISMQFTIAADPEIITEENGYTLRPSALWKPPPTSCEGSEAKCESEMQSYTEQAAGPETTFDMIPIPGGRFMMGSPETELSRREDEGPQVEMRIRPFWMGRCEVTWEEFREFASPDDWRAYFERPPLSDDATLHEKLAEQVIHAAHLRIGCSYLPGDIGIYEEGMGKHPAVSMSQRFARAYCIWLTARTGRYYRLPTEAEWEYACRAGTTTAYSFGDDMDRVDEYCRYWSEELQENQETTLPSGSLKPNPWGLYDMHGNVSEWCLDGYVGNRHQELLDGGAGIWREFVIPPQPKVFRRQELLHASCVVRGGSWFDDPEYCRSASRSNEYDGISTAPSNEEWDSLDRLLPPADDWYSDADWVGLRVVRPLKLPTETESRRYEKGADSTNYRKTYDGDEPGLYEKYWGQYD